MFSKLKSVSLILQNKIRTKRSLSWHVKLSESTSLARYTAVYSGADIRGTKLGEGSYVGPDCDLRNSVIGKYCSIGPRVRVVQGLHPTHMVSTHPCFYSLKKQSGFTFAKRQMYNEEAFVKDQIWVGIGSDVWIGSDVTILAGVSIGDGSVIGTGSLVTKNIAPYSIAHGVPAKTIKKRFSEDDIDVLNKIQWWNWGYKKLSEAAICMLDIENFKEKFNTINK